MRAKEILSEVNYTDLYPKTFEQFRQKYLPMASRKDLYVNFNDDVGNADNKTFSQAPTHNDPTGLYAYPLDYVLNHPADIAYGQQARYLRVIQDVASNKLVLTHMTDAQSVDLLAKMGIENPKVKLGAMQAAMTRQGIKISGNKAAKLFFWAMQQFAGTAATSRPAFNQVQSKLLLKAGVDCIEDVAQSRADATIFPGEPEQIVFLKRSAFRVVEAFELRSERSVTMHKADRTENMRRLPALIAQAIGDRIVSSNTSGDRAAAQTYYTAEKRKLVVTLSHEYDFMKSHREHDTSSPEKTSIILSGPDFKTITANYERGVSFQQIVDDIAERFKNRIAGTGQSYDRESEYGPDIQHTIATLKAVADKLKLPFTTEMNSNLAYLVYKTIRAVDTAKGVFKGKADWVARGAIPAINSIWNAQKVRAAQADQIVAIYEKLATTKKVTSRWDHGMAGMSLQGIARQLDVRDEAGSKQGGSFEKKYGDLTIARQGTDVVFTIGGKSYNIAKIENNKLSDFSANDGRTTDGVADPDRTKFLPYAADIAEYFNSQNFYAEGYATYLPERFGVVFKDGHWSTFEDTAEEMETLKNGIGIWKLPENGNKNMQYVVARVGVSIHHPNIGEGGTTEKSKEVIPLFGLNSDNQITYIAETLKNYLQYLDMKKKNPNDWRAKWPRYGYHEDAREKKAWDQILVEGKFDIFALIKKFGFTFGPHMNEEELEMFGLRRNQDNGKVAKSYANIMDPVGKFDGIQVYKVQTSSRYKGANRYYLVKGADKEKPITLMVTQPDHIDGKSDASIKNIMPNLSLENRKVAKALIAHLELPIPKKMQPLLSSRIFKDEE